MQLHETALAMLSHFALSGRVTDLRPYGEGHINNTFAVQTDSGARFVLQRISPVAFKRPDQVMENVANVTAYLRRVIAAEGGDPDRECLSLVPLADGSGWSVLDEEGGCWRVYLFIGGAVTYQLPDSEDLFRKAGRAFGRFQRLLDAFPAATLHETIPLFHHTPARVDNFRAAVARNASHRLDQARAEVDEVSAWAVHAADLTDQLEHGTLPLRVTHNDTKLNNILMDAATGSGLCIVDLDTMMPGLAAYDFGDAIRFGASTAAEDEPDLSKVHFSLPMFRAYAEGYLAETAAMLTEAETASLATGAMMMTFECGMRFLTDFIDGDVYFHTAYPEHNLVRARTQLALLREMCDQEEAMLDILLTCRRTALERA